MFNRWNFLSLFLGFCLWIITTPHLLLASPTDIPPFQWDSKEGQSYPPHATAMAQVPQDVWQLIFQELGPLDILEIRTICKKFKCLGDQRLLSILQAFQLPSLPGENVSLRQIFCQMACPFNVSRIMNLLYKMIPWEEEQTTPTRSDFHPHFLTFLDEAIGMGYRDLVLEKLKLFRKRLYHLSRYPDTYGDYLTWQHKYLDFLETTVNFEKLKNKPYLPHVFKTLHKYIYAFFDPLDVNDPEEKTHTFSQRFPDEVIFATECRQHFAGTLPLYHAIALRNNLWLPKEKEALEKEVTAILDHHTAYPQDILNDVIRGACKAYALDTEADKTFIASLFQSSIPEIKLAAILAVAATLPFPEAKDFLQPYSNPAEDPVFVTGVHEWVYRQFQKSRRNHWFVKTDHEVALLNSVKDPRPPIQAWKKCQQACLYRECADNNTGTIFYENAATLFKELLLLPEDALPPQVSRLRIMRYLCLIDPHGNAQSHPFFTAQELTDFFTAHPDPLVQKKAFLIRMHGLPNFPQPNWWQDPIRQELLKKTLRTTTGNSRLFSEALNHWIALLLYNDQQDCYDASLWSTYAQFLRLMR